MLTREQVEQIDGELQKGVTPEQVASDMGLTYHQLRTQLLQSGRRIAIYRKLESTAPISAEKAVRI